VSRPKTSFEGWINELPAEYDEETYHVSLTNTLHAKIDGRFLIMSHTKPRASRVALWNERPIQSALIQTQRLYDLQNCTLQLLPKTLPFKKTWSKKYPICLEAKLLPLHLYPGSMTDIGEEATLNVDASFPGDASVPEEEDRRGSGEEDEEGEDEGDDLQRMTEEEQEARVKERLASSSFGLLSQIEQDDMEEFQDQTQNGTESHETERLYLFARTSRQKEVWFRRLVRARKYPDTEEEPLMEEYQSSMKELMALLPRGPREEILDPSVLYSGINALVHRICFDLRRNPMIMGKMERIIQKRLDAIKLPSVMEKFELVQLDLGSRIPFIKHVNQPYLNELGLWVDMEISYKDNVVSTVKTRLNLTQAVEPQHEDQESDGRPESPGLAEGSQLPGPSQVTAHYDLHRRPQKNKFPSGVFSFRWRPKASTLALLKAFLTTKQRRTPQSHKSTSTALANNRRFFASLKSLRDRRCSRGYRIVGTPK